MAVKEHDKPSNYIGKWKDLTEKEEDEINKARKELRGFF